MDIELKNESLNYKSWVLNERQICDLEMILNGGFAPLNCFLSKDDYESVLSSMRLNNGSLWPIPINLDVNEEFSRKINPGDKLTLRDKEGFSIAIIDIEDIWNPDLKKECMLVYGTTDNTHPGVDYLLNQSNPIYVGGKIRAISKPNHYDYREIRHDPKSLKKKFKDLGWTNIVAFQTRNPLHKAHVEMTLRAIDELDAKLLIHPVVGMTKPGDVDHYTRVRCYKHVLSKYPDDKALLSLIPLAMRMAGPREALWHAIIRKNYGCSHFIVGRDHAGVGDYYEPFEAQEIFDLDVVKDSLKIEIFKADHTAYSKKLNKVVMMRDADDHTKDDFVLLSGTKVREMLAAGQELPPEFARKEVAKILMTYYQEKS